MKKIIIGICVILALILSVFIFGGIKGGYYQAYEVRKVVVISGQTRYYEIISESEWTNKDGYELYSEDEYIYQDNERPINNLDYFGQYDIYEKDESFYILVFL